MQCEQCLSTHGTVTALCIDKTNGCIAVGVQDIIRYKRDGATASCVII